MSAVVRQKFASKELSVGANNSRKKQCFVFNATHEDEAVAAMLADTTMFPVSLPITILGNTFSFTRGTASAKELADGMDPPTTWEGEVEYAIEGSQAAASQGPYQTGDEVTTFEIGTQSVNKKHSISTSGSFQISGTAPSFGQLINVSKDGVQGVDVDVPTFTWSETHYMADADVDDAYINDLYSVVSNPINDDTFRDLAAGEVKIVGVQGTRRRRGGDWEINFRFAATPNVTGLTVGSITGISKLGWEYLWFYYEPSEVTVGSLKYLVQKAKFAYVEKVYEQSDFSLLGIGT